LDKQTLDREKCVLYGEGNQRASHCNTEGPNTEQNVEVIVPVTYSVQIANGSRRLVGDLQNPYPFVPYDVFTPLLRTSGLQYAQPERRKKCCQFTRLGKQQHG
jgi:hypothetical protein